MTEDIRIDVTPNVKECVKILKSAVETLPHGDLKERAVAALGYLEMTFRGEPQPGGGRSCPGGKFLISP